MDERMNSYGGERRPPINPQPRQQFYPQNQMQGYPQNPAQGYPQNSTQGYPQNSMQGYPQAQPYPQNPAQSNPQGYERRTAQPSTKETMNGNAPGLAPGGFKPLSKEERAEAAKVVLETGFSLDGYQVVRREFFSHKYDPALTIREDCIVFNNACISKLEDVVYVLVLINADDQKLVVRPCAEGTRDAIRWCIPREDKRKSRQISCERFTKKLYEMMDWKQPYRYKLQGTRINYQGEEIYIFDLTTKEPFLPTKKNPEDTDAKPTRYKAVYSEEWENSFGLSVKEHEASMRVDLRKGYETVGMSRKNRENVDETGPDIYAPELENMLEVSKTTAEKNVQLTMEMAEQKGAR